MRPRISLLALCALALSVVPSTALAEAEGATIDKTGWWNRAQTSTPTPAGPVTVPPPPGVPEGDLAVGGAGSEPTAILGVGIQPDDGPGATVDRFVMRLTEDPDAQANQGTEVAALLACPITAFWAGGENSDFETAPEYDCGAASASGTRNDDGVWEFDLAPIGRLWFDPFGTVIADGVVVVPDLEESSAPFQAVFKGGDDIDVILESTPSDDAEENPFAIPDPPADAGFNSGGSSGGGGGSLFSPPVITQPPAPTFDAPSVDDTPIDTGGDAGGADDVAAPPLADEPAAERAVSRAGDLAGNLSPLVLFGILAVLGLLLATSYWFGPAGQPVTTIRQRGVSRALAARARVTKGT